MFGTKWEVSGTTQLLPDQVSGTHEKILSLLQNTTKIRTISHRWSILNDSYDKMNRGALFVQFIRFTEFAQ